MKSVLISIRPEWCDLIVTGNKTIEVRKTKPKLETPFKVYIYCTAGVGKNTFCLPVSHKRIMEHYAETGSMDSLNAPIGNSKVIGQFICDEIKDMRDIEQEPTCLSIEEWLKYTDGHKGPVYGWHISNLKIYDEPKELCNFLTIDKHAVKRCEYRERACNNPDLTNGAFIPGSYVCIKGEIDWCSACKRKTITRPPQSWCYVEELA